MSQLPNGRIARMDKARPTVTHPGTSLPGGGKKKGTGVGSKVLRAIKQASEETACGNCGNTDDLMHSDRCAQLLCRHCRKLHVRAVRTIPHHAKLDRYLGTKGMVIPGTHWPLED